MRVGELALLLTYYSTQESQACTLPGNHSSASPCQGNLWAIPEYRARRTVTDTHMHRGGVAGRCTLPSQTSPAGKVQKADPRVIGAVPLVEITSSWQVIFIFSVLTIVIFTPKHITLSHYFPLPVSNVSVSCHHEKHNLVSKAPLDLNNSKSLKVHL